MEEQAGMEIPHNLFAALEGSYLRKKYFELWNRIFDKYIVVVDGHDLEYVYCALRAYYQYKISEMYDQNFTWNYCYKNNFKLGDALMENLQKTDDSRNFTDLRELLTYMSRREIIPIVMPDSEYGFTIRRGTQDRTNLKLLKSLHDIHDDAIILKEIMYMEFSMQGRKPLPLKAFFGNHVEFLEIIKPIDLLRWTSENDSSRCFGKMLQKPHDCVKRNFRWKCTFIKERSIVKMLWSVNVICGESGSGKSTALDAISLYCHPKCFVIRYDLEDCVDDLMVDGGELFGDPIGYFFKKSQKGQDNYLILEELYRSQRKNNQLIIMLDSFEYVLYEFSEKLFDIFEKMTSNYETKLVLTIDSRNEFLIDRKLKYPDIFYLQELNKSDIQLYFKSNGILDMNYIVPPSFVMTPLYLNMISCISNNRKENVKSILQREGSKIIDVYNDFIKQFVLQKEKPMDLISKMALAYCFGMKHSEEIVKVVDHKVLSRFENLRKEFPHRTIAEYLVAKWICSSKELEFTKYILSTIFQSYQYYRIYDFLFDILHHDKELLKSDWLEISPLKWALGNCIRTYGKDYRRQKLHALDEMVTKFSINDLKNEISKCFNFDIKNVKFEDGDRFLHIACKYQGENIVKALLNLHFSPNFQNEVGRTPLHYSCLNDNLVIIKCLLDFGGDINLVDENGDTPLHLACRESKSAEVIKVLLEHNADPNIQNQELFTCLQVSVTSKENLEIVETLLKYGANPNMFDSVDRSPLYLACRNGSPELLKLLINYGADPNIQNELKWTALHEASNERNSKAVKFLLPYVTNPNAFDDRGLAPLHLASYNNDENTLISLLSDDRVDPNQRLKHNDTTLHYACSSGMVNFVKILLEAGANPNLQNNAGLTPLHSACFLQNEEMVKLILETGVEPTLKTTCVRIAREGGASSILKLLLKYTSDS